MFGKFMLKNLLTANKRIFYTVNCLLFALLALGLSGPSYAERIYKWVDEQGNTHYSTTPPPGSQAKRIKTAPPPSTDPNEALQKLRDRSNAFNERQDNRNKSAEEQAKEAEEQAKRKKACDMLRNNLKVMTENPLVREQLPNGEFKVINEEDRQARMKKARERIQQECQ